MLGTLLLTYFLMDVRWSLQGSGFALRWSQCFKFTYNNQASEILINNPSSHQILQQTRIVVY